MREVAAWHACLCSKVTSCLHTKHHSLTAGRLQLTVSACCLPAVMAVERWRPRQCRQVLALSTLVLYACALLTSYICVAPAVQLIADLVRRRKCVAPPATLDCLLQLRFPDIVTAVPPLGRGARPAAILLSWQRSRCAMAAAVLSLDLCYCRRQS